MSKDDFTILFKRGFYDAATFLYENSDFQDNLGFQAHFRQLINNAKRSLETLNNSIASKKRAP